MPSPWLVCVNFANWAESKFGVVEGDSKTVCTDLPSK
jgi:hypothetical protein